MLEELTVLTEEEEVAISKSDLKELNSKQLKDLVQRANELIGERAESERQEARQKVQAIAEELGISVFTLLGVSKPGRGKASGATRTPAKAKYRLPNGSDWSGKGRIPLVLREALNGSKDWDAETAKFESAEARETGLKKYLID